MNILVEIKGSLTFDDAQKVVTFCRLLSCPILLLQDINPILQVVFSDSTITKKVVLTRPTAFRRCPVCRHWALRDMCDCDECKRDIFAYYTCHECLSNGISGIKVRKSLEWIPLPPNDELSRAIGAARSARFEHGETPKVPRGKPRKV
jgi:hypothetical protein